MTPKGVTVGAVGAVDGGSMVRAVDGGGRFSTVAISRANSSLSRGEDGAPLSAERVSRGERAPSQV